MSEIPLEVAAHAERLYDDGWCESVPTIIAKAILAERERCASIIENFASGRSLTGEAVKDRKVPSQTSILMAQLIRGGN